MHMGDFLLCLWCLGSGSNRRPFALPSARGLYHHPF